MDNASSSSAADVVQAAKSSGVFVYSIGIGNPNSPAGMRIAIGPFAIGGMTRNTLMRSRCQDLRTQTAGRAIIQKVGNGAELKQACDEISKDLHERHSNAIGFVAHALAS
jgi:hypothetical protein